MKSIIREFVEPSNEEKKDLWENSIFIFDTNVLLNLYRYSNKTRETLLDALDFLKNRIWLPYQVAYEFMKDRCNVIYETIEHYNKLTKDKNSFLSTVAETLRLKETEEDIVELDEYINNWITKQKDDNLLILNHNEDSILYKLFDFYNGRTGEPYNEEELSKIKEEGNQRYEKLIPPGYKDSGKKNSMNDNNMFGDFILWKQIIDYAKTNKVNIIFVTHDQKEDWWNIVKGKTIGPRIELRKEFIQYTNQDFYMYSMNSFIEIFSEYRGISTDQSVIDEVLHFEYEDNKKEINKYLSYSDKLENSIEKLTERIVRRQKSIEQLEEKYHEKSKPKDIQLQIDNTRANINKLLDFLHHQQNELRIIRNEEYHNDFHNKFNKSRISI